MYDKLLTFRDFSSTKIPEPSRYIAIIQNLRTGWDSSTLKFILFWIVLPITLVVVTVFGIIGLFISKKVSLFFKIAVAGLLLIAGVEGWLIKVNIEKKVTPGSFFNVMFTDFGDDQWVTATGTWRGVNEKIAYPINTAQIQCRKSEGICREINAEISGNTLLPPNTYDWKITNWDDKEITVDSGGQCRTSKMIINFKDEAVTQISTPREPLPADCIVGVGGKFITELVGGIIFPKSKKK